ncbi:MAG: ribbon-helix-helix domain-containing protein [Candidatus Obscuribacterales bacterium]|nr:ribbon-helix-helix domain-containing protein [Candidatus Obscuribacterales bacterium]
MSEGKSKFTASVRESIVDHLDQKAAELKLNRSEAVERAIEMWLTKLAEEEEEEFFANYVQTDEDASWTALTTASFWRNHDE